MVNSIVKAYLVAYNAAQAVGWLVVLSKLGQSYVDTGDFNHAFVAAGNLVRALQLAAFLEFLHASFGLVRSGALTSLMQWGGRTHVLLAVIAKLPEAQVLPSVFIVFTAWSISEVIRYPQYALSSLGACPRWLVWLRQLYSGIFGQLLPFTYDKFVLGLLIAYPFLFVILFLHMFKQRRSKLSVRSSANRRTSKGKGKRRD
ncbi:hypothetical protein AXG93_3104s1040 [Marchantia polymorpha subsp. ruderalis]|uniref:Very-long-chain (3R)-3-hydroxyacyl-CoA dehydratase n=1 Tax=Marchantia polymorpha subsp. ruderalis TaxID=1480154 RepID=A0A176WR73_MARPO|nr:hypothetical protein AXG93_3104s1040 [Marchantia polymorpha subsp. ruderalis]